MPFASIAERKVYYEIHGQGSLVVLLHHGFGCTRMWKEICPGLIESGYRVMMYDRRGYGQSENGEDFESFYVSDRFREESVNELSSLMKFLDEKSFHVVGQCEGGVVGVDYAAAYPDQVRSLAISSTQCFSEISMPEFNKIKFPHSFSELDSGLRGKLIAWHGEGRAEQFFNLFRTRGGAYGTGVFDLRDTLPSVQCPALVLYPDRSFLFDVEQGVCLYRHLPAGELAVLPACGHNTYEHRPSQYLEIVLEFLRRHSR